MSIKCMFAEDLDVEPHVACLVNTDLDASSYIIKQMIFHVASLLVPSVSTTMTTSPSKRSILVVEYVQVLLFVA